MQNAFIMHLRMANAFLFSFIYLFIIIYYLFSFFHSFSPPLSLTKTHLHHSNIVTYLRIWKIVFSEHVYMTNSMFVILKSHSCEPPQMSTQILLTL
jgi:hypothetical protein